MEVIQVTNMRVKIQTMLGDIVVRLYQGTATGRADRPVDDIEMRMTVIE